MNKKALKLSEASNSVRHRYQRETVHLRKRGVTWIQDTSVLQDRRPAINVLNGTPRDEVGWRGSGTVKLLL